MATRVNQRERTRRAIVRAAVELYDEGTPDPTVDAIAERALVSRATVYRYFDKGADAVWQGLTDRTLPSPVETVETAGADVRDRVARAEDVVNTRLFGDLDGSRTVERATLDRVLGGRAQPGEREARRLRFIDTALEPIADALGPDLDTVRHALALTMGTQVIGALVDTCQLDVERARQATAFAADAIAQAALRLADEAAPNGVPPRAGG